LRRALIEIVDDGAAGHRSTGLTVIEVAELPDEPSQAFAAFRPASLLKTRQR